MSSMKVAVVIQM